MKRFTAALWYPHVAAVGLTQSIQTQLISLHDNDLAHSWNKDIGKAKPHTCL